MLMPHIHRYNAITANLAGATLYNVNITPLPKASSPDPHTGQYFQFEAKSIREGWPPVTIGDKVILKPLNWSQQRAEGVCLEARIWALQKLAGLIVLRCDKLIYVPGMTFVVQWKVQDRFFAAAHSAIAACDRALSAASPSNPIAPTSVDLNGTPKTHSPSHSSPLPRVQYDMALARSWLFPEKQDLDPTLVDWPPVGSFNWHDPDLNPEQRQAVRSIVFGHRRVPYLVSGPPGTGKTKLLTESILQLLKHNSQAHLLVCGASNPSADTLTRRLAAAGLDHHTLFRLNHSSRPLDEVRGDISMFCRLSTEHGQFEMPSLRELLAYRVVVTSAADASLLYEYHACNSSLQGLSHHVSSAVHPLSTQPTPPHWTHMLLDEAAQAHEPDSLIPLSVVLPISQPNTKAPSFVPQIVFCGDVQQLGPRIWSEEARSRDLDNSLLGRLFLRDVYATHPEARRHLRPEAKKTLTRKKQTNSKKQSTTQTADVPFVNLIRNYRSHTAILAAPSVMFYEDTLVPCVSPAVFSSTLPLWQGQVRPGFPVSFWNVDSPETMVDDGASWANWAEIDRVCNIIHTLLSHCAGKAGQMPSLTPRDISVSF